MRINVRNEELGQISLVSSTVTRWRTIRRWNSWLHLCPSHIETVAYYAPRIVHIDFFLVRGACRNREERKKERKEGRKKGREREKKSPLDPMRTLATSSIKRLHKQVSETRKFFTSHAQIIFHFYLSFFPSSSPFSPSHSRG